MSEAAEENQNLANKIRVANRRLAVDAAETDIDEPGAASQLRGLKLAFTDIKVYILAIAYVCSIYWLTILS